MCAIVGVTGNESAIRVILGLGVLNKRGEQGCGVISSDNGGSKSKFKAIRKFGRVDEHFATGSPYIKDLVGDISIGQNLYRTTGMKWDPQGEPEDNLQPLFDKKLGIALAHNGNIQSAKHLRRKLEDRGVVFQTNTDSEVILKMIGESSGETIQEKLTNALLKIQGSYALLVMTKDVLIGVRDPYGANPLCIGQRGERFVIASEDAPFTAMGFDLLGEVEPGEMVTIENGRIHRSLFAKRLIGADPEPCAIEMTYFSRPESNIFGKNIGRRRIKIGEQLYIEKPFTKAEVDCVMSVPESANFQAVGYANASGLPLVPGIVTRSGRTFTTPTVEVRRQGTLIKYGFVSELIQGQRILLVDDSLIRGNTMKKIIAQLYRCGAKSVHVLISFRMIQHPCVKGIAINTYEELIAHTHKLVEDIRREIKATSLYFGSASGMNIAFGKTCTSCMDGIYATLVSVPIAA